MKSVQEIVDQLESEEAIPPPAPALVVPESDGEIATALFQAGAHLNALLSLAAIKGLSVEVDTEQMQTNGDTRPFKGKPMLFGKGRPFRGVTFEVTRAVRVPPDYGKL